LQEYVDDLGVAIIFTSTFTGENVPELFFKTAQAAKESALGTNTHTRTICAHPANILC
jgi:hypothetical protein